MSSVIYVEYSMLSVRLRELGRLISELETNIRNIVDLTDKVDIFWDGDSNAIFVAGLNENIACIETMIMKLRNTIKLVDDAIEDYQETEKVIENIIGGLKI